MENRPKVGVGVIVMKGGKVLLGKRKNAHGEGSWSFGGGHLEFGETWEACAKRETLEEVGITIKNLKFVTATNDIFSEPGTHYITIYMRADHEYGEVRDMEPHKAQDWRWVAWDEIPKPYFLPLQHLKESGYKP